MKVLVDMNLSPDWCEVPAATRLGCGPLVGDWKVRAQDTLSPQFRNLLVGALRQFQTQLEAGPIVVVEQSRARARILPLR